MDASGPEGGVDLEKELTCSICTELLYQPLTLLDCLHTFCGSCLAEWFTFQHAAYAANPSHTPPSSGSIYTCPSCRASVRDTKHNAIVKSLLDMYVSAHPDRQRSDSEMEEVAKKYKPGDRVMPKVKVERKSERERRAEEHDRRLVEEVRAYSLRETGLMSDIGTSSRSGGTGRRREERRREREREREREEGRRDESRTRPPRSRNPSRDSRLRRESREPSQRPSIRPDSHTSSGDESRSHRSGLRPDQGAGSDTEGPRRRSADGADGVPLRQVEHQSSLRELIASDSDTQREIEDFSRQIQEEGLLNGIDLNNIDLSDSELSRRITEAYRRRQRQVIRAENNRRSNASGISRNSEHSHSPGSGNGSDAPRVRTSDATGAASRPASRHTMHARSTSTTSQAEERSRPPVSNVFLDPSERRRRRRTASESRSATEPTRPPSVSDVRPAIRSTSDLPSRTGRRRADSAGSATRPVTADARISGSPTIASADQTFGHNLPFSARMPPIAVTSPNPQTSQPHEMLAELPVATRQRKSRPADITVPSPTMTAPPTSAVGGAVATLPSPGLLAPTSSPARPKVRSHGYVEPMFDCSSCNKPRIQYDIHYNCFVCNGGNWNVCLSCYRNRKGCMNWFGFGRQAYERWEKKRAFATGPLEVPHILAARRYITPRPSPPTNDRGQLIVPDNPEARLQSGNFCVRCLTWANDCCWRCTRCNFGDWGYCNDCVNTGNCCSHALLPLTFRPDEATPAAGAASPPPSPRSPNPPQSASVVDSHSMFYPFKPLTFTTTCDLCQQKIQPTQPRLHCNGCKSGLVHEAKRGDYDICLPCYSGLGAQGKISMDNSMSGWRRCPNGHRMTIVVFEEEEYGRRRVMVRDVIGGLSLEKEDFNDKLEKWKWPTGSGGSGGGGGFASRLVSKNVEETPPSPSQAAGPGRSSSPDYPPSGGLGKHAIAKYGWYPGNDTERQDELMMPKMAEISEVIEVNDTFWRGSYMGKVGYFPVAYVDIKDNSIDQEGEWMDGWGKRETGMEKI